MSYQALNSVNQIRLLGAKAPKTQLSFWNAHRADETVTRYHGTVKGGKYLRIGKNLIMSPDLQREIWWRELFFVEVDNQRMLYVIYYRYNLIGYLPNEVFGLLILIKRKYLLRDE